MALSESQLARYGCNIAIDGIGKDGQEKLLSSRALVIGAGGLGSAALFYLSAAGVGTIGVADGDTVDISNLQRQIIHNGDDVGRFKTDSAREKINKLNPDARVAVYARRVDASGISGLIGDYDIVLDCTDNFTAKFLINDACVAAKKPFVHCGVLAWSGQIFTYLPGRACYRCVFKDEPAPGAVPTSAQAGILGAVPGVFGSLQAAEAIKYLSGQAGLLTDRLLIGDIAGMEFRTVPIRPDPACPVCFRGHPL